MGSRGYKPTFNRKTASQRSMALAIKKAFVPPRPRIRDRTGVENKYFDVVIGFVMPASVVWDATTNAMPVGSQPQIAAGDDVYQRNGRKIMLKRVHFKGNLITTVTAAGTAVTPTTTARVVLWRNMGNNLPGVYLGLADGAAFGNTITAMGAMQSPTNFGVGKIVDDISVQLAPTAAANNAVGTTVTTAATDVHIELGYRPKQPIEITYSGTGAATILQNQFVILANAEAATFNPSLQGVCRFYYTDA